MSEGRYDINFLKVEAIRKVFGNQIALSDISFSARKAEFICVLGPSGCGKSTLLRVIAGLETPDSGRICFDGKDITKEPVAARNVGIVFQSYALFPNLTAFQNIAYGLVSQKLGKRVIRQRVDDLLNLVGLSGLGDRYPAELSGGQQQRVALARAMALSPSLLLLDEPLSALDAQVRGMLRTEIRRLQQRLQVTTLMVTHDQEEALSMGDRILVMHEGRIVQDGTPAEIYDRPASPFVAAFVGSMNFLEDAVRIDDATYQYGPHRLRVDPAKDGRVSLGCKAVIGIRPEDIRIGGVQDPDINTITARVRYLSYRGAMFRVSLGLWDGLEGRRSLEADIPTETIRHYDVRPDMPLRVHLPIDRLRVYPHAAESALP